MAASTTMELAPYSPPHLDTLPPADTLPPGATVLSLRGTDRSELRKGVALWGLLIFGVGLAGGYYLGKAAR